MEECMKCSHEEDIVLLKDHVKDIGKDLKLVLKTIRGNGEHGIITKQALQEQSLVKLHDRIDDLEDMIEKAINKVEGSVSNEKSIRQLWKAYAYLAIPIIGACIKIFFFGE